MKAFLASSCGMVVALMHAWIVIPALQEPGSVPEWVQRLGWTLVHSTWQLLVVGIVAGLVDRLLRHRTANFRYGAGVAMLSVMAVVPCLTWTMLEISLRTSATAASEAIRETSIARTRDVHQPLDRSGPPVPGSAVIPMLPVVPQVDEPLMGGIPRDDVVVASRPLRDRPALGFEQRWSEIVEPRLPLLVMLWLVGVVLCSLRPVWGLWTQWRLRRTGLVPVSEELQRRLSDLASRMGVTRIVSIARSAHVCVPMVVGYLRPVILLPVTVLTGLTSVQLESLLAHELAHVRRHDWLVNALQILVETVLFHHPAVWWLSNRIRHERELCCDDMAIAVTGDRATYGRMLLALEELRHGSSTILAAGSIAGTGGNLVQRVRRLLPHHRVTERSSRGWLSGTIMLGLLVAAGIWFATRATAEHRDLDSNIVARGETADDARSLNRDDKVDQESPGRAPVGVEPPLRVDPTVSALEYMVRHWVGKKDWPQWCGTTHRNNTPSGENIPTQWNQETGENILWTVSHERGNITTPVVANGKVFVAGNNLPGMVRELPRTTDLGCLRAHDAATGKLLWQATHPKLAKGKDGAFRDWPSVGICSPPTVEGDRLWYVSNRSEVICLDTEGFRDGENDGPFVDEIGRNDTEADIVWQVDLVKDFHVEPHLASASTVLCVGEYCFVITSNGVGASHQVVVNPQAPSFVCLHKQTGRVVWTDNSPGDNILAGCWSSPCAFDINGETQVVMAGGDGWLYSFHPEGDGQGHAKLLWKFDANPKESRFVVGNTKGVRSSIVATPVFYGGHVYFGVGESPEHGEGPGRLWCLDPTRRGDVSYQLAVDSNGQPLPQRRLQAVDTTKGEKAIPNPNSAAVWCYSGRGQQPEKKNEFEQSMHRTLGNVAIKNDLVVIADFSGIIHCVDAREVLEGKPVVYWTHDLFASAWGTPLIVEDKVYVGDEDGDVLIFALSREKKLISEQNINHPIQTTPIVANDTLFINSTHQLIAIKQSSK